MSEPARISPEMRVTVVLPAGVLWARGPGADGLEESLCYTAAGRVVSPGLGPRASNEARLHVPQAVGALQSRRAAAGHHDAARAL